MTSCQRGLGKNLEEMDKEMRKSFALKTEILGCDLGDVRSLKVLDRQISLKDGQINWEADSRHVEILARQLGMEGSSTVKIPGDKRTTPTTSFDTEMLMAWALFRRKVRHPMWMSYTRGARVSVGSVPAT